MRAYLLDELKGPSSLRLADVPDPAGDADTAVLDVRALGINFPDLLATKGLYQNKNPVPFVPGCEIAGTIRSAPAGCGWAAGDRAAAFVWDGGYAEQARVPVASLCPIPEGVDFETAAGMIVNYQTVLFALQRRGRLEPGERLLVLGAAGGIGTAAIQVGKGLGASVVAGVADEAQVATATAAGADEVIVLTAGFAQRLRDDNGGRGIDVVLDPLGDWLFAEALRALEPEGRILVIGFAAGDIPSVRVNRLLLKNVSAVGVAWGAFLDLDPQALLDGARTLDRLFQAGFVRPQISERHGFADLPRALARLEAQQIRGKAVVTVDG